MKNWLIKQSVRIGALASASALLSPLKVFAIIDTPPTKVPTAFGNFENAFKQIFNIVIVVAGIVFTLLILVGGIQYLAATGNEDATKKARALILDGVIGLVIILLAWAVGTYVLQLLGVTGPGDTAIPTSAN